MKVLMIQSAKGLSDPAAGRRPSCSLAGVRPSKETAASWRHRSIRRFQVEVALKLLFASWNPSTSPFSLGCPIFPIVRASRGKLISTPDWSWVVFSEETAERARVALRDASQRTWATLAAVVVLILFLISQLESTAVPSGPQLVVANTLVAAFFG